MSQNSKFDIEKIYVSPYDKFLAQFDKTHAPSPSQLQEREKAERIAKLRDNKMPADGKGEVWEGF